jgi:hypothetical protein
MSRHSASAAIGEVESSSAVQGRWRWQWAPSSADGQGQGQGQSHSTVVHYASGLTFDLLSRRCSLKRFGGCYRLDVEELRATALFPVPRTSANTNAMGATGAAAEAGSGAATGAGDFCAVALQTDIHNWSRPICLEFGGSIAPHSVRTLLRGGGPLPGEDAVVLCMGPADQPTDRLRIIALLAARLYAAKAGPDTGASAPLSAWLIDVVMQGAGAGSSAAPAPGPGPGAPDSAGPAACILQRSALFTCAI